ncbi:MAG TPA: DUF6457 domain-containing protein [Acidimicrobiales bacterium]|nr:DUF6457 domain-containing protein [Acidimicrobiales bacterium]
MVDDTAPTGLDWVAAFARQLGMDPPGADDAEVLLELASVAAHASERLAAPLACYLVGRAGVAPADALAIARTVTP